MPQKITRKMYSKSTIKRNLLLRVDMSLLFFVSSHDFRTHRLIDFEI